MSNPIGWCDITLNPISGCLNNCPYCYARKMAHRLKGRYGYPEDEPFKPAFHPDKLQDIYNLRGAGKRVFLDSMSDWGSYGVKTDWIGACIDAIREKPEHTFLVLTKRPSMLVSTLINMFGIPENLWIGVSVTCQEDVQRIYDLNWMMPDTCKNRFVSFEPLHGPIEADLSGIGWVIIGAESGNRKGKIVPENEWAYRLVEYARNLEIPVFVKDNFAKAKIHSKEFPREMIKKETPVRPGI